MSISKLDELNLLSALMIAAQCEGGPVTYLILTLRLNGYGGERVCRGLIDQLRDIGYIEIDQEKDRVDRRTKNVRVTQYGWDAVGRLARMVKDVVDRKALAEAPQSRGVAGAVSAQSKVA
jgi:hypothetical protein